MTLAAAEALPVSIFDDILKADAANAFCDPDVFGEAVVYTKPDGTARTINAVIDRAPPVPFDAPYKQPSLVATVANHATYGIASSEVNYGGDTITVAQRIGGPPKPYKVHQPADGQPDQDHGMLRVELR